MKKIKSPLISVILPVYNVGEYIQEAIISILKQTIQDFEIIVIDDCSTDNTLAIIDTFDDSRIRIIKKTKNKGLIDSLNIGFKEAKGQFIARMDGDDISIFNRFEKQLNVLQNNKSIKACGCWLQCFGTSSEIIRHKEFHKDILCQMLISCPMSMGSVMLVREAINGFSFEENKIHVEDYDFWSRVVLTFKLYNLQEVLYLHRSHKAQISAKYKSIQVKGDIKIRLFLFKKINYDAIKYSDYLIKKMLLLNEFISVNDLELFLSWIKELTFLNRKPKMYPQKELENVLQRIKRDLLFSLYFKETTIGIDKQWRQKALLRLSIKDAFYILIIKIREIRKRLIKR